MVGFEVAVVVFLDHVFPLSCFDLIKIVIVSPEFVIHVVHKLFAKNQFSLVGSSIDINNFVFDFDGVSGDTDNSFDVIYRGVFGVFENDDISPLWGTLAKEVDGIPVDAESSQGEIGKGDFESVLELVDQDKVSDHQGGEHGFGWDAEGFEKDRAERKNRNQNDKDGLAFPDKDLFLGWFFC